MNEKRFAKKLDKKLDKKLNKFSKHYSHDTHNNYNVSRFIRLCVRYYDNAKFIVDINKGDEDYETTLFEQFAIKRNHVIHYI